MPKSQIGYSYQLGIESTYILLHFMQAQYNSLISISNFSLIFLCILLSNVSGCSTNKLEQDNRPVSYSLLQRQNLVHKERLDQAIQLDREGDQYFQDLNYKDAENAYQRAKQIRIDVLGKDTYSIVPSLHKLATLAEVHEDYQRAFKNYQQAQKILGKTIGLDKDETKKNMAYMAAIFEITAQNMDKPATVQNYTTVYQNYAGGKHPYLPMFLNRLGVLALHKEEYGQAEVHFNSSLEIAKKTIGEFHPYLVVILTNHSDLLQRQGRQKESQMLLEQAEIIRQMNPYKHHTKLYGNKSFNQQVSRTK